MLVIAYEASPSTMVHENEDRQITPVNGTGEIKPDLWITDN